MFFRFILIIADEIGENRFFNFGNFLHKINVSYVTSSVQNGPNNQKENRFETITFVIC